MITPPRAGSPTTTSRVRRRLYQKGDSQYCILLRRFGFEDGLLFLHAFPGQILNVVKGDEKHKDNDYGCATGLDDADGLGADWLAAHALNDGEKDVAAIEHRDGKHVEERKVDVHQYAEPKRQTPPLFGIKEAVIDFHDFDRSAEVLGFDARFAREQCA